MISRQTLKSRKFIVAASMMITLFAILLEHLLFNGDAMFYEYGVLPVLSLVLGPYGVVGFIIIELLYWIFGFGATHIPSMLINVVIILILGVLPWKLWYAVSIRDDVEAVNINSLRSFIKLCVVLAVFILQYEFIFTANMARISTETLTIQYSSVMIGIILLIVSLGIWGRYKLPFYTPSKQPKRIMPGQLYDAVLLIAIIIEIAAIGLGLSSNNMLLSFTILLMNSIFLSKPFDDDTLELSNTVKLSMFAKVSMSIFAVIAIIAVIFSLIYVNVLFFDLYNETFLSIFLRLFLDLVLVFIIPLLIYMLFLENRVINPIQQLSSYLSRDIDTTEDYEDLKKNLEDITVNNEIKSLSESLLDMGKELVEYGENLIQLTRKTERYETELKLAKDIQYSMIPTDFEEFTKDKNVSLWGLMKPAREVGGDFYDYFSIDDDNIGFVIGDVSGKGVTAALVMVKAMTSIQDFAKEYDDLSEVFHKVNNELCKGNDEGLFVTSWLAKLNIKTGTLSYVNAGHNPPLIMQDNGDYKYLDSDPGIVLAAMEDMPYEEQSVQFEPGDSLFLYTDGVTEANDDYNGFYGEERLKDILNMHKEDNVENIIKSVEDDVDDFCNHQEQFDDTTMFIIRFGMH